MVLAPMHDTLARRNDQLCSSHQLHFNFDLWQPKLRTTKMEAVIDLEQSSPLASQEPSPQCDTNLLDDLLALEAPNHDPSTQVADQADMLEGESRLLSVVPPLPNPPQSSLTEPCSQPVQAPSLHVNSTLPSTSSTSSTSSNGRSSSIVPSSSTSRSLASTISSSTTPASSQQSSLGTVLEIDKGVFADPTIGLEKKDRDAWLQIKGRLDHTFDNTFPHIPGSNRPLISSEFMMAGPSPMLLQPAIVFVCVQQADRKQLKKVLKKQKWLSSYPYNCVVILDSIDELSHGDIPDEGLSVQAYLPAGSATLCGVLAQTGQHQQERAVKFTVGGVIIVGDKPYGLTVRHALHNLFKPRAFIDEGNGGSDYDSIDENDEDDSDSPFVNFASGNKQMPDASQQRQKSSHSLHEEGEVTLQCRADIRNRASEKSYSKLASGWHCIGNFVICPSGPDIASTSRVVNTSRSCTLDWILIRLAALELDLDWCRPNTLVIPGQSTSTEVLSVAINSHMGGSEVWINAGSSGMVKGWMTDCPVTLHLEHGVVEARQIITDRRLATGDSGSWVIVNNEVCGHVVAARATVPWVYMVSMEKIFDEITASTSGLRVRLPRQSHATSQNAGYSLAESATVIGSDALTSEVNAKVEMDSQITKELGRTNVGFLSRRSREYILQKFWGCEEFGHRGHLEENDNLQHYWRYVGEECLFYQRSLKPNDRAVKSLQDLFEIVQMLKSGLLKNEIKDVLRSKLDGGIDSTDENLKMSIDLAARLLLMMNIDSRETFIYRPDPLIWEAGSLKHFVRQWFDLSNSGMKTFGLKVERTFTARNLERVAGLKIIWTDNLANHLRVTDDDTQVFIFHHASFLQCQLQSTETLFPEGFVDETLRTLALLFPQHDVSSRKWFSKKFSALSIDQRAMRCRTLPAHDRQIDTFRYWRDRLILLKEIYDESQPKSVRQWWYDRRNPWQWYTFWIAILIFSLSIFFGLLQSILGSLQVYYAIHDRESKA